MLLIPPVVQPRAVRVFVAVVVIATQAARHRRISQRPPRRGNVGRALLRREQIELAVPGAERIPPTVGLRQGSGHAVGAKLRREGLFLPLQ